MLWAIVAGCEVVVAGIASHAFHAWLRQRERERLSATDVAKIDNRFRDIERQQNEFKNALANLPRR